MPIKYASVSSKGRILAEFSLVEGNHRDLLQKIIKKSCAKFSYADIGNYVITVHKKNSFDLSFACISTRDIPLRHQNEFLDEIRKRFLDKYPEIADSSAVNCESFTSSIRNSMEYYNYHSQTQESSTATDRKMTDCRFSLIDSETLNILDLDLPSSPNLFRRALTFIWPGRRGRNPIFFVVILLFILLSILFITEKNQQKLRH